jgi:hypothetical protein
MKSVSYEEMSALLKKVDGIGLESNYNKVVNDSLDVMSEFYNVGMSNRKYIPVSAVELFLKEKNLTPFLNKMEEEFVNPEVTRYDISEYKNAFAGIIMEFSEVVDQNFDDEEDSEFVEDNTINEVNDFDTFGEEVVQNELNEDINEKEEIVFEKENISEDSETHSRQDDAIEDIEELPEVLEENVSSDFDSELNSEAIHDTEALSDEEESDELDITEDERVDGKSLEEGIEFLKEEKEITELTSEKVDPNDSAISEFSDDSDPDLLIFEKEDSTDDELTFASDLLDKELDGAKALYLEETESEEKDTIDNLMDDLVAEPDNITINIPDELLPDQSNQQSKKSESSEAADVLDEAILSLDKAINEDDEIESDTKTEVNNLIDQYDSGEEESELEIKNNTSIDDIIDEDEISDESLIEEDSLDDQSDNLEEVIDDNEESDNYIHSEQEEHIEDKLENESEKEIEEFGSLSDFLSQDDEPSELLQEIEAIEEEIKTNDDSNFSENVDETEESDESLQLLKEEADKIEDEDTEEHNYPNENIDSTEVEETETLSENDNIPVTDDLIDKPIEYKQNVNNDDVGGTIDLTELLENKKMNKIVESVFDYDMEDFANAIEKIAEARSKDDALLIVENICEKAQVGSSSKEAKLFKSIIADYFD